MIQFAALAAAAIAGCEAGPAATSPTFDAARLREGRFTYDLSVDGKHAAQFVLTIRRQADGSWRFTGDELGFDQHWEAVTDPAFRPKSALLTLKRRGQPYRMELTYGDGKVSALETEGKLAAGKAPAPVSSAIEPVTVDQRIDWASMMAADLSPGTQAAYHVFDAMTGSSRLFAVAEDAPAMDGPLGRQAAVKLSYRICKDGEPEPYVVWATRSLPRVMLREELRGHEAAVLIKVEP